MAIKFPDFTNAPLLDKPGTNIFEDVLKGYKMSQEPAKMREEQSARQLANKLKELDVQHKPTQYALDDKAKEFANALQGKALEHYDEDRKLNTQLKQAQIDKAKSPAALKGALYEAFQVRNSLDPNSPTYEKDVNKVNNYIDHLAGQTKQGASEPIEVDLPNGEKGYMSGLGKLQVGNVPVTNAEGKTIGLNVPMNADMAKQWKAKTKFDVIYPFMNKALAVYSGSGSWERFTRDVNNYSKDESAKKRVDDFLAAKKLISIGSTTENARIGGHATNSQLDQLRSTLDSSEVFKKLERGRGFRLPPGYSEASGNIFKEQLDKVEEASKKDVPAYEFRYLNPNQNASTADVMGANQPANNNIEGNGLSGASNQEIEPEIISSANGFTIIKNGNKTLKLPNNLVDKYMNEHIKPKFGAGYEG